MLLISCHHSSPTSSVPPSQQQKHDGATGSGHLDVHDYDALRQAFKEQLIEGLSAFLLVVLHHHKCQTSEMEVGKEYGESYKEQIGCINSLELRIKEAVV